MEDTQLIALYYKEHDPMKRKMFWISPLQQERIQREMPLERNFGIFATVLFLRLEMDVLTDIWDCGCPWNTTGMQAGDSLA